MVRDARCTRCSVQNRHHPFSILKALFMLRRFDSIHLKGNSGDSCVQVRRDPYGLLYRGFFDRHRIADER